ncbi:zinc finger, C2H2 type [Dictyocaulus viviparus]|uniref:Zinc finger, C2H2 type n=1 Tax=Dictyocaulus viviparus TaxID=29172 RepID=A0A0D8XZ15_DICVI|nr:zinc finger, C2H2 type [Dictyocaulus viviparus]
MKIHAERGYLCQQCGRSFTRQQSLDEHTLKCKAKSAPGTATPPIKIEQPSPVFPLISQPFPSFNQEDVTKMAQSLIAQQQQRALAALFARQQAAAHLSTQPAVPSTIQPVHSMIPSLFCALCSKVFPNQPAFAIHMYVCHIQGSSIPNTGDEQRIPVLTSMNSSKKDSDDSHVNVISSTTTNPPCSPSPQDPMSTAVYETSSSTSEEMTNLPAADSLHRTLNQADVIPKFCTSCRLHAVRSTELEAALLAKGHELERFKEMMRVVVTTTGQLLNHCSPDNVFIAHTKNIFAQLQSNICSSE